MKKRLLGLILFFTLFSSLHANSKTALIAGGAGFLGSHLCDQLMSENYKVICLDSLQTGSIENIKQHLENKNFSFIKCDVINLPAFKIPIDEIYNLACAASPPKYQIDPLHTLKTNFLGTFNLLNLAKEKNAKFLQASTSETYGNPLEHPQKESYFGNVNTMGLRACYDEGKRIAETLCFEFHHQYNVKVKVARIFNTYGPRMAEDDGRVVTNFLIQALNGYDITIYGDGLQTRSFCYVSDLIKGFRKFMQSDLDTIGPINLGNPQEVTISNFAQLITEKVGHDSKVSYLDLPQDDPLMRRPDISKAKELLDWEPSINIDEGLDMTLNYFSQK